MKAKQTRRGRRPVLVRVSTGFPNPDNDLGRGEVPAQHLAVPISCLLCIWCITQMQQPLSKQQRACRCRPELPSIAAVRDQRATIIGMR